jgi:hypothetical protein
MDNKTIFTCPNCTQKSRIPADKHIKFTCPNCKTTHDFDGRNIKENENFNTKSASEPIKTARSYNWLWTIIILGFIIYFAYNYINKQTSNITTNSSTEQVEEIVPSFEDITMNKIKDAMDVDNEITRSYALNLAARFPGEFSISQICSVYDNLFKNWSYVNDPRGMEYFAKSSFTINAGLKGDCDDFAILMATLIESIGGHARIVTAYNNKGEGHAYTEVRIGKEHHMKKCLEVINERYSDYFSRIFGYSQVNRIYYQLDKNGMAWLNLDWSSQYPGGTFYEANSRTIYYPRENKYEFEK